MTILTEKTVYLTKDFFNSTTFFIILGIAAFIGLVIGFYTTRSGFSTYEKTILIFLFVLLFSIFGSLIGAVYTLRTKTVTERTEYEVYLEDMTYNELAEAPEYTIVSVEGKKITIVDKEWRYYEGYEK